jgi:cyclin B
MPQLMPETLYLTVNLIDRFLEQKQVTRKHLQLVGVTAMLVASKYEEIWAPEVRDFVYISDRAYTRDQILNMEKIMLNSLRFNLTVPSEPRLGSWRAREEQQGAKTLKSF